MNAFDAVILAGGRSERLHGIVAPYHKPFLVINGRALLVAAVEDALAVGARRVVVVATGENAMPVHQLVSHHDRVRVVLSGGGPAHALSVGMEMCYQSRILVLMADNQTALRDIERVVNSGSSYAIGTRLLPRREAVRFTRLIDDEWIEGSDISDMQGDPDAAITVWCGPLVVQRSRSLDVLPKLSKIGPVLAQLAPVFTFVPVSTVDVGVPEVVQRLTGSIIETNQE